MAWLLVLALVAVVGLFLAGYRKTAVGIAGATLIAGVGGYYYEQQRDAEAEARIAASDVTLANVTFRHTFRTTYELSGSLTNKSEKYSVDGIGFTVTLKDCKGSDKAACAVVGTTTAYASVRVPPQEARKFVAPMYFGSDEIKPKGKLEWEYEITSIVARRL